MISDDLQASARPFLDLADALRKDGVHEKIEQADLTRHIEELSIKLCGDKGFCADKIIEIKLQAPDAPDLTIIGTNARLFPIYK